MATGAIKKVTNESGTGYCKMPDGTLLQYGLMTMTAYNGGGNGYPYTGYQNLLFDKSFTSDPIVVLSIVESATNWTVSVVNRSQSGFTAMIGGDVANSSRPVQWIAIGRWK